MHQGTRAHHVHYVHNAVNTLMINDCRNYGNYSRSFILTTINRLTIMIAFVRSIREMITKEINYQANRVDRFVFAFSLASCSGILFRRWSRGFSNPPSLHEIKAPLAL